MKTVKKPSKTSRRNAAHKHKLAKKNRRLAGLLKKKHNGGHSSW